MAPSRRSTVLLLLLAVVGGGLVATAQAQEKLLFGYQLGSDVTAYLALANHVRGMRRAASIDEAKSIYANATAVVSLQSLSTKSWELWKSVPMYNVYVSSFQFMGETHEGDASGNFDRQPARFYADTLVQDLFELEIDNLEATAAVTLNVVMAYWGYLYQFILGCERGNTDNAHQTMTLALDTAVALWIGDGQERNENQAGHMLYNMAEQAGARFGQDEGESTVNTQFLETVIGLKEDIERGTCSMLGGYKSVHSKVKQLIKYTNVVLVQMLIHFIYDAVDNGGSLDFVEVLSLALLPQVHGCDTTLFDVLVENTVNNDMDLSRRDTTIATLQKALSCFDLSCSHIGSYENGLLDACTDPQFVILAGYTTSTDVGDLSELDRDIRHIRMAMDLDNGRAASDLYAFGWNSETTLRGIATRAYDWAQSNESRLFDTFYANDSTGYGHSDVLIDKVLRGVAPFTGASIDDRLGVVVGSIQSNVMYLAVIGQLDASLRACEESQADEAALHWDGAAALMIGSAEGEIDGGQIGGQSIFAVSKQLCESFGTCEPGSSVVDTILLASIRGGAASVKKLACEEAQSVVSKDLHPNLLIALLQGVIFYTVQSHMGVSGAHGYLLAYTQSILPYVTNENDAAALKANTLYFQTPSTVIDVPKAFRAITNAATALSTDCSEIGQILIRGVRYGLCPNDPVPPYDDGTIAPVHAPTFASATFAPVVAPLVSTSSTGLDPTEVTDIAWGRYSFSNLNTAFQDSLFTLDVRDMYSQDSPAAAGTIYVSPSKHATAGLSGHPEILSLQDFSAKASFFMREDPMYNFFRLALFDDNSFDGNVTGIDHGWAYGNAVEQLAIGKDNGNSAQLGSMTAVVMEIWMMIVHRLYEAARKCKSSISSPELIDSAVGLWIGQDQQMGSFQSGWSVYSLAQEAAELYGLNEEEAKINTVLMEQFNNLKRLVLDCAGQTSPYEKLRKEVDDTVKSLSVPLLQHLLFYMSDNKYEYVELFALGFIPQTIGVDEGVYEMLRDAFFQGFNRDSTVTSKLLESFGKVLHAMRFSCEDLGETTHSTVSLKGIVGVLCDEVSITFTSSIIAGYQATATIEELARIDLDVLQIDLFMRASAYDLAFDVYKYGRNSRKLGGDVAFLSLSALASAEFTEPAGDIFDAFADFFLTDQYADKVIIEAMVHPEESRFAGSSRRQRSEAVRRTIQTTVVYLQVVSRLRTSILMCSNSSDPASAQESVDQAAALYIGSIEGPFSGGSSTLSGQMIYALAKEMCKAFGTCEGQSDAVTNVRLEFAFSSIKEALVDRNCNASEKIINEDVLSQILVPMIQGSLYFADANEGSVPFSNSSSLAAGDSITEALLPQIAETNETSAAIIFENMDFEYGQPTMRSGKEAVFSAYSSVVGGLGVDCSKVGIMQSSGLSVCSGGTSISLLSPTTASAPSSTTNLGKDLYVSTTNVQDRANIAVDVKEMEQSLLLGRVMSARIIYLEGRNSAIYNSEGKLIDLRTLESFSASAFQTMVKNPIFHTFVFALADEKGRYLGSPATSYADSVVKEMFEVDAEMNTTLAAEASVCLNLWMEVVNELFEMIEKCDTGTLTDEDGINSIDEAAAYWIGDGQIAGNAEQGHLLYALAETMGAQFNLVEAGQSRTNTNILELFHEAKMEVSQPNICMSSTYPPFRLGRLVNEIINWMVSVNIQALIHYLRIGGEESRVRIYAHAFVPLLASCDPLGFNMLKADLLESEYKEAHVESIVATIRRSLHCFDLTCADIGIHAKESSPACQDSIGLTMMAEYKPTTDVHQMSQLDLDILELGILLDVGAVEAAEHLYTFGRHAAVETSVQGPTMRLQGLATSNSRTIVPQFDGFRRFFDNDSNYGDTLVRTAMRNEDFSNSQKKAVVAAAASFLILHMAALEQVYEALSSCSSGTDKEGENSASRAWDSAAALLIGSMEGQEDAGSSQGQLVWSLSKKMCQEFNTCSVETPGSSRLNDEIATLLYDGRDAASEHDCENLEKISSKLVETLRGPFIQASLSYAVQLSQPDLPHAAEIAVEAFVVVRTLLPIIADIDGRAAEVIEANFPLTGEAMSDGLLVVSGAFFRVFEGLGVDCELLGKSDEIDFCAQTVRSKKRDRLLLSMFIILGTCTIAAVVVLLRVRSKRIPKPMFVKSNGELNHVSDLIPKRIEPTEGDESTTIQDEDKRDGSLVKLVAAGSSYDDEIYEDAIGTKEFQVPKSLD